MYYQTRGGGTSRHEYKAALRSQIYILEVYDKEYAENLYYLKSSTITYFVS